MADDELPATPRESPLSLSRLRDAFAAMLGGTKSRSDGTAREGGRSSETRDNGEFRRNSPTCVRDQSATVVEAMLFVGGRIRAAFGP